MLSESDNIKKTTDNIRVVLNAGLWLGDPDIDALSRLFWPIKTIAMDSRFEPNYGLGNGTWAPFNDQNTAISREIMPIFFRPPSTGRNCDIWTSYVVVKLAEHMGDIISFGESKLEVLFTPGHSPGHICFYSKKNNLIISGDIIFQMSIGRTDLPFGDYDTLIKSITEKIFPLPGQTQIHCGHGPSTVLNYEREHNPFLQ